MKMIESLRGNCKSGKHKQLKKQIITLKKQDGANEV